MFVRKFAQRSPPPSSFRIGADFGRRKGSVDLPENLSATNPRTVGISNFRRHSKRKTIERSRAANASSARSSRARPRCRRGHRGERAGSRSRPGWLRYEASSSVSPYPWRHTAVFLPLVLANEIVALAVIGGPPSVAVRAVLGLQPQHGPLSDRESCLPESAKPDKRYGSVVDATHRRLAKNIRARARELDIPLTHVADRADVGRANFWTVLKGTSSPTLKWIVKVAATLQCDAAELLKR